MFKQMKVILAFFVLAIMSLFLLSCKEEAKTSYNGKEYDLSVDGSKSVTAKTVKVGTKYTLTISGSGEAIDFEKKESVPWNPIQKSIDKVVIEEGVSKIGSYYFYSSVVDEFYLPESLKTISSNAFNENQTIYSYGNNIDGGDKYKLYYYSEKAPSEFGKYFHLVEGVPVIWAKYKVLFVGNSFTYYTNTTENPLVPYLFKAIADDLGLAVEVDFVVKGSHTLTGFSNPNDEMGKILYEKLNSNDDYTHVILQEQSTAPINSYNNFVKAVGVINDLVKETQKNCEVVLYETWGSPTGMASTGHKSVGEMEKALQTAYDNCAKEYNLKVCYVGKAFTYVYEQKKINLYFTDNRHQNEVGAYLSSCVHLASILKADVRLTNYSYDIDKDTLDIIKDVAFKVGFNLPLDSEVVVTPPDDTEHLLVIAWYAKTSTSGLNQDIIDRFTNKLKDYLKAIGYSEELVNSVLLRAYSGNVGPSCESIKNDGDVNLMIGWKSNVDTTGALEFIESFPTSTEESGIKMGEAQDRWIHRLTDDELTQKVFNWIISEKENILQ